MSDPVDGPREGSYDIAIIGGGPGGYVAAIHAAHLGARVALVEQGRLGGACLNSGCIPTKALVKSAEVLLEARRAGEFGVEVGEVRPNFPRMMERKRAIVNRLVGGIEQLIKGNGVTVIRGTGRLLAPQAVEVTGVGGTQQVRAARVVIATGALDGRIPIPGLDLPGVMNSEQALEMEEVPRSITIIGGGVEGIEFACLFNALGSKVTVVEMMPAILPMLDDELARRMHQVLRTSGVSVVVDARARGVTQTGEGLSISFETKKGVEEIAAERVLLAVGRRPNTTGLMAEDVGLAVNRSAVLVNERLETNLPGVYAIGDVTGRIMVAHVAAYDGEVAVENALGRPRLADYRSVPNCVFAIPEIATVGWSEKQARESGIAIRVTKFPLGASGRAATMGEGNGLVKMVCEDGTGRLLGLHILGPHASDIIAEGALAIRLGMTAEDLAHTIHSHPTLPETVHEAALGQLTGAIHTMRV